MELTQSITITKRQIAWLLLAISKESHKAVLNYGRLQSHKGKTYIVTTDTHRLHAVKVADREIPVTALLDLRRMLYELKYHRLGTSIKLGVEQLIDTVEICDKKGDPIETVNHEVIIRDTESIPSISKPSEPTLKGPKGAYPSWFRAVPDAFEIEDANVNGAAFNFQYLSDASRLSDDRANRIYLSGASSSRSFVIKPLKGDHYRQEWFAVIMPMAVESVSEVDVDRITGEPKQARKKAA